MGKAPLPLLAWALAVGVVAGAQELTHTVQEGETFYSLSRRFGVSVEQLLWANRMQDPRQLRRGQVVIIPQSSVVPQASEIGPTHRVERGETVYSLARRYGTTVEELLRLNRLARPEDLRAGSSIRLPTSVRAQPPATAARGSPLPLDRTPVRVSRPVPALLFRAPGAVFHATTDGTVVWVAPFNALGNLILVEAEDGLVHGYAGWSRSMVAVRDRVRKGQTLGSLSRDPPGSLLYFRYDRRGVIPPSEFASND